MLGEGHIATGDFYHRERLGGKDPPGLLAFQGCCLSLGLGRRNGYLGVQLHAYGGIYSRLFRLLPHVLELCGPRRRAVSPQALNSTGTWIPAQTGDYWALRLWNRRWEGFLVTGSLTAKALPRLTKPAALRSWLQESEEADGQLRGVSLENDQHC